MPEKLFCVKHHFKIVGAEDSFLIGNVYFACVFCGAHYVVDRLSFYQVLQGRPVTFGH